MSFGLLCLSADLETVGRRINVTRLLILSRTPIPPSGWASDHPLQLVGCLLNKINFARRRVPTVC